MYAMRSATVAVALCTAAIPAVAQGLAAGERIATELLDVRAPSSAGWQLSAKNPARIALGRAGDAPNETFAAFAIVFRLEPPRDRDHFMDLIRKGVAADTPPSRFRELKADLRHDESRGHPCIRYTALHEDLQAKLRTGATGTLITQTQSLYCVHPDEKGAAYAAGYSHRGDSLHAQFETEADQFIGGSHVRAR
jgi:hypothetical protein